MYVIDQLDNRVEQFDAAGEFVRAFGWGVADGIGAAETCMSGCQAGIAGNGDGQFDTPQAIAIDQSDGSIYVVDGPNNNRVEKFDAGGTFLSQFGSAGTAEGQLSGPQGIAVDPTDGSVYVADTGDNRVEKFDHTGTFVNTFGLGVSDGASTFEVCTSSCQPGIADSSDGAFNAPTRVAVDSTGRVYVLDAGNGRVERFTSADAFDEQFDPTDVNAGTSPVEIAIGPGTDHLYVAQAAPDFSEQRVFEIDSAGVLVDTHGVGSTASNVSGLAVSAGSQKIYVADGFNARVFILDDVTAPTATIDPASNVTSTSASLSGAVTPNGAPDVGWHFEISTDDASWSPVAADRDAGSGNSPVPVSEDLTNLVPNTAYFARLVATRPFNAPAISSEIQFDTPAVQPDVATLPANDVAPTHATFQGALNAHNADTTYFFEYGTTTSYGHRFPATDADGGTANDLVAVMQRIDSLQQDTTYHYRIVATNGVGTVHGADQSFTTTTAPPPSTPRPGIPGAGFLPDNRGWEQVSPVDKHGNDVMPAFSRTHAAASETPGLPMAVAFSSLGAFGDARGTGISNEYMSIRTGQSGSSGWTTHAITPAQTPSTLFGALRAFDPEWEAFSPDLSRGAFRAWSPLDASPSVGDVENLYVRDDLRDSDVGSYQLLSSCPVCTGSLAPPVVVGNLPWLTGASDDFSHVAFESEYPLVQGSTADPSSQTPNLYEWDNGTLRLAGILPDGTTAPSSMAGQGQVRLNYTPHTMSRDGSRVIFTDNSTTGDNTGDLYMRIDAASTVQINASETGASDSPATYWEATPDDSRVFFTTAEQLTSDDTNQSLDAYMYDLNAPSGHRLTRLSVADDAQSAFDAIGVIGVSNDGHYAYFMADGDNLISRMPRAAGAKIYEWHDGAISYVGLLSNPGADVRRNVPFSWGQGGTPMSARVAPDGRHLLFTSQGHAGLTGYDNGTCGSQGCQELYLYSADTHEVQCVSCDPNGTTAISSASVVDRTDFSASDDSPQRSHALSDDGADVFFSTADPLVPGDTNGRRDVYEFDSRTGTEHLVSSGTDPSDSYFMDASADGSNVFFVTHSRLTGWDSDGNYDLYDARRNGGVPDPPKLLLPCSGDSCHGAATSAPASETSASSVVRGSGNVKQAFPPKPKRKAVCRHGFVRKRVKGKLRCVRKPAKHRKKRSRGRKSAVRRHVDRKAG